MKGRTTHSGRRCKRDRKRQRPNLNPTPEEEPRYLLFSLSPYSTPLLHALTWVSESLCRCHSWRVATAKGERLGSDTRHNGKFHHCWFSKLKSRNTPLGWLVEEVSIKYIHLIYLIFLFISNFLSNHIINHIHNFSLYSSSSSPLFSNIFLCWLCVGTLELRVSQKRVNCLKSLPLPTITWQNPNSQIQTTCWPATSHATKIQHEQCSEAYRYSLSLLHLLISSHPSLSSIPSLSLSQQRARSITSHENHLL